MILTVTPNPALDSTITLGELDVGESHRVAPAVTRAGGKGINVARVLMQQGYDTLAVAPVGSDDRGEFERDLGTIPALLVPVPGPARRSTAIVESGTGRTTVLNESGRPVPQETWTHVTDAVRSRIGDTRCLVVAGSIPPGSPDSLVADLLRLAADAGIPSVADASGPYLLSAAAAGATLLKPNRRELAEATGEADPLAGARALQRAGAHLVLVSLGEDGMMAVPRQGDVLYARLDSVLAGNPTGAGDAAVAGAASLLAAGDRDIRTLLSRACAWGAAAVLEPQAGSVHPDCDAIERRITITTN
ncbi:1-phosphofructokinase family hexose kinase [Mycetocola manganoxydans]|uniref:1-phosphofructokinase family hexose kinase n=1 Tax=Mycetocola manganoxydans TaxID=699879 RepID=A0A3L6ZW29_9MICO|nr:hexose kinase [Mycetocola manganoxydans]RLP72079.1 1-phosphofructokinase family hexose kinase [Mycetocola manganoxydans]GHD47845.1 sugar kinase [Mycetocola manganoxydans]